MCLILFAWQIHPEYPLIVCANRDEQHQRPATTSSFWEEAPHVLAGRDLLAGGTWMGVTRQGRFAAVTNVREPHIPRGPRSRGSLVANFLLQDTDGEYFQDNLQPTQDEYSGYNLLLLDVQGLMYLSNRAHSRRLPAGLYGVSNASLDTPWPKVTSGKQAFAEALSQTAPGDERLFALLSHREIPADHALPDTGIGLEGERVLGPRFILQEGYGTRSSTVLHWRRDGQFSWQERTYSGTGELQEERRYAFQREA